MPNIFIGTDLNRMIYIGESKVKKVYLGTDMVFSGEHIIKCYNCQPNKHITAVHSSGRQYTGISDENGYLDLVVYDDGSFTVNNEFKSQAKSVIIPVGEDFVNLYFDLWLFDNGEQFTLTTGGYRGSGVYTIGTRLHAGHANYQTGEIYSINNQIDFTPYNYAYATGYRNVFNFNSVNLLVGGKTIFSAGAGNNGAFDVSRIDISGAAVGQLEMHTFGGNLGEDATYIWVSSVHLSAD